MRIDGQSPQLNVLSDENESIGADGTNAREPNAVISMIDYVLNTHGCEDLSCTIRADNCSDSGFAYIKKPNRRSDCDIIQQLDDIVNKSSTANEAVRYPTWRWRGWNTFLSTSFKAIPGIRKYQYFRFDSSRPGTVFAKKATDLPDEEFFIMKHRKLPSAEPCLIKPAGLSENRVKYLYRTVRHPQTDCM
ncbi:hypothetical protein DPMN_134735 [Dreissena polymorpha]|uniref:Uncharacterized protein n=1 Tax=Dreissena polymorpha TaxID=45954 RepID=A0A9D4FZJ1_DREPO|nr:hypothetical protein DPMN_134735 [Dreissena polymorpha]